MPADGQGDALVSRVPEMQNDHDVKGRVTAVSVGGSRGLRVRSRRKEGRSCSIAGANQSHRREDQLPCVCSASAIDDPPGR
jgi:hypothetical protein